MKDLVREEQQRNHQHLKFTKFGKIGSSLFKDKTWMQKYSAQLESQFRKVVREEVELAIERSPLPTLSRSLPIHDHIESSQSQSRHFKLEFEGKLLEKLFTGNKVETEENLPLKIMLLDTNSGRLITEGPLSSKKVEVCVLYGHFKPEKQENWTKEEFRKHVVFERKEKRPLLVGQRFITLHRGVGIINDDIYITDNSSWAGRSKMFRLGAKLVGDEDQVREAISIAFKVKDRRGETYQKHINPALEDEVWRLEGISKSGKICKRLEEIQVYKVQDLVKLYYNNESSLLNILKVRPKKWKAIIEQATTWTSQNCSNPNNLAEINYHDVDNNQNVIPCPILQQFGVNDQQNNQMSTSYTCEPNHQMDQSTAFNSTLFEESLARSWNDVIPPPSQDISSPQSFDATFITHQNSICFPIQRPMEKYSECNNYFEGSSCTSTTRMLSSNTCIGGVDASQIANLKMGWEEYASKCDEAALKKGKFLHYQAPQN